MQPGIEKRIFNIFCMKSDQLLLKVSIWYIKFGIKLINPDMHLIAFYVLKYQKKRTSISLHLKSNFDQNNLHLRVESVFLRVYKLVTAGIGDFRR